MCGRYASTLPPDLLLDTLAAMAGAIGNLEPNWNVAPTQNAPVARLNPKTGKRQLDLLTWGLVPNWTKDLKTARRPINARAETVATSGMFRDAFARRRCLVPATLCYEWLALPGGKQPYAIARTDGTPTVFGGLWEAWRDPSGEILRSFTIISTTANAEMSRLHERMPVVLEPHQWPGWLGEVEADPADMLRPAPDGTLRFWPVSRAVNSVRNNGPELAEPVTPPVDAPV